MSEVGIVLSKIEVSVGPSVARDTRIDVLRGLCILMMALDHFEFLLSSALPPLGFRWPFVTWASIGWSSAAEFFFFFSGYVFALVSLAAMRRGHWVRVGVRAVNRTWQLYCVNLVTWAVAALMLHVAFPASVRINIASGFDTAASRNGLDALVAFAALRDAPAYFDILPLYMLFLPAAACVLPFLKKRPGGVLLASCLLWTVAQVRPDWTLYNDAGPWGFNPLAWQLMFVCGMVAARVDLFGMLRALPQRRVVLASGAILMAVFTGKSLLFGSHWGLLQPGFVIPLAGKDLLQPLRLAHFAVSLVFLYSLLPEPNRLRKSKLAGLAANVGRMSLESFCCSTLLCYAATSAVLLWIGASRTAISLLGLAMLLSLCGLARSFEWWKKNR